MTFLDVRAEAIPPALRALPSVLWRAEPNPENPEKPSKVPYRIADPERRASSTNPATWGTFDDAVETYSALVSHPPDPRRGAIAGLGVVLTADAGVVCVDLDRVLDETTLDPRAQRIVDRCASWTEVSPSGRGLHVFGRGVLARAMKGPGIEVYGDARYIAVTGHHWPGTPLDLRTLQGYLDRLMALDRPPARSRWTGPATAPPDDLAGALVNRLQELGADVARVKPWQGGALVELRECPWAHAHTSGRGGAAVILHSSGAFDFTCLHAHCAGRTWRDFRAAMETAPR